MARYKILRVITWLPAGGIERKICAVLPRLNRDLFEPRVVCLRERGPLADDLEQQGIPVDLIPFSSRLDPIGMLRLRAYARNHEIDLIHSHMYRANTPATLVSALLRRRPPVVAHYHNVGTWESRRQWALDRTLANRRTNVAVSEAVRRDVITQLGLPEDRVRCLPNGVDIAEFRPAADPAQKLALRRELSLPEDALLIVQVARLVSQKNHRLTLAALPSWLVHEPRAMVVFLGDGPDRPALEQLAVQEELRGRVRFLGRRDDVARILPAFDIAVLPSSREGFSNALLETMAAGLPAVASSAGGNSEAVEDGVSGIIVPLKGGALPQPDRAEFAHAVSSLLNAPARIVEMGAAARRRAESFSIERMVNDIESLYLELLETPA